MSTSKSSFSNTFFLTVSVVIVAQVTWNNIPYWVKDAILGRSRSNKEHKDANDDLANPTQVFSKIKEVMNLAHELSEDLIDDSMPPYRLYCSFMSMIHLMIEIDASVPEWREKYFSKDGEEVPEQELQVLLEFLDYAEWAYLESQVQLQRRLRPLKLDLIRYDNATEPGRVGHYIAVHHETKHVIFAIKGTSTLSDVFTDIIGKAIPHTLEGNKDIRCHEGMYVAAQMLLQDTMHMIENFFAPQGYKLTICGHSLGAGVSCLLGMFVKQHLPDLELQVYAFATPACSSYEASTECADYITSIVNNNDCVPRLSLMNLRTMNKILTLVDSKLEQKGLAPKDFATARDYFSDLMKIDSDLLLEPQELTDFLEAEFSAPRSDRFIDMELYVPGKVVSVWNHTSEPSVVGGRVTDGHSQVLKQVFMEPNMVTDHSCDCYRANISQLAEQIRSA